MLDKAIIFAVNAHKGTERRGKGFPYIVHPLEAVEIVATMTPDQELLAAAALHDTVEDTDVTIEQIREEFGERIASLVQAETVQTKQGESEADSWRSRKQRAIDTLASASRDAKMVALGDKLSNMRAIWRDYTEIGDKLWDRFHAPGGKKDHEWHYRSLANCFLDLSDTFAFRELMSLLDKVFGLPEPELVDMSEWEESGDGFTAISYNHRDGKLMMKLYADFIPAIVPQTELRSGWDIMKLGLTIPAPTRMVTDGKRVGVEFQRIVGKKSFARAISQDPSSLEFYAKEFAHECKKLHSTKCDTSHFRDVKTFFLNEVRGNKMLSEEKKKEYIDYFSAVPDSDSCIHGDMHIGNILTNGEKNYWIDLADFAYGYYMFDFGMYYFVSHVIPDEMIEPMFHISPEQMRKVWDIFILEYFGQDADIEAINRECEKYSTLNMIRFDNRDGHVDDNMRELMKNIKL